MDPSSMPTVEDTDTTAMPTSIEMRAPDSRRARMSRPSSSSPNGCDRLGGSSRRANSCPAGSYGEIAGPTSAATIAIETMRRPTLIIIGRSLEADPRIQPAVRQVRYEVDEHVGDRDEQNAALHQRVVAEADRLDQQPPDARPRENRLRDDRPGQHRAELEPDDRDDRDEAVPERVAD